MSFLHTKILAAVTLLLAGFGIGTPQNIGDTIRTLPPVQEVSGVIEPRNTAATLKFPAYDCTGNTNGGALTADANGVISCSDDASGSGSSTNSNIAFLTIGNTSSLSYERSLTATSPLAFTDGGVNSTYDLSLVAGYSISLTASATAWESLKDSGPYLALTGGTLTGTLFGTKASLSSNLEIGGFASISNSGYLKIPWGVASVIDANGKLAVDDSGFGQLAYYASGSVHTLTDEFQATMSLGSTSYNSFASRSLGYQFRGITIKRIWCSVSTATSVVINLSSNGTTDMDQLTCSTSGVFDDGNIANSTLTKGTQLYLERRTITGEADFLTITYTYVKTRE